MLVSLWIFFPANLFETPKSKVVFSREGNLLSARIAGDGQWRFPESKSMDSKIEQSILTFEDEYFYWHFGVNPVSIVKALSSNIKSGEIKRGGSTISMQTIRLWLKNPKRSYIQKIKELFLVVGLELNNSKKEILQLYLSNAPFGGNVVGVESASWRYFNRKSSELSWAEAATLAVLPNSPSLIHPGRNRDKLLKKRNFLLKKLYNRELIDSTTYSLALLEEIPDKPYPLPNYAPHLLQKLSKDGDKLYHSTIDYKLQKKVLDICAKHNRELVQNRIFNLAVLVIDLKSNEVVSYVGNSESKNADNSNYVDIVQAPRSTGSILKPILYAAALDKGMILPHTLLADIPTQYNGFMPENYIKKYEGAVPAGLCLSRSLNIPSVRLLRDYGIEAFYKKLEDLQLKNINRGADNYGLSLILGGAESSLWNISRAYAWMAEDLNYFQQDTENNLPFTEAKTLLNEEEKQLRKKGVLSRGAIFSVFEALRKVNRPENEAGWQNFNANNNIAWKTGTSHGFKDAWSVGWTKDKLVAVWVGNADGEGRPGILGVSAAAPLMFDVFSLLKNSRWFEVPHDDLADIETCSVSGMKASEYCEDRDTILAPLRAVESKKCDYHKAVHLDKTEKYRVNSNCYPVSEIVTRNYFVLPSVQAWYYKKYNTYYKELPAWKESCNVRENKVMQWIYPNKENRIFIPKNKLGEKSKVVFELAHQNSNGTVYWHIDGEYVKTTKSNHTYAFIADKGFHTITCLDSKGNSISKHFEVVD
ncbi:MAG: penicillin-binding protein 1C [Bacteroidota bacterium]